VKDTIKMGTEEVRLRRTELFKFVGEDFDPCTGDVL
jgi:hypothetical protein